MGLSPSNSSLSTLNFLRELNSSHCFEYMCMLMPLTFITRLSLNTNLLHLVPGRILPGTFAEHSHKLSISHSLASFRSWRVSPSQWDLLGLYTLHVPSQLCCSLMFFYYQTCFMLHLLIWWLPLQLVEWKHTGQVFLTVWCIAVVPAPGIGPGT